MATKEELAQLSLYVYKVQTTVNRPDLPSDDWDELAYNEGDVLGLSYGVFKNNVTGEVVVAYTGTNEKKIADFMIGNIPAATGAVPSPQISLAAVVAAQTIETHGAANVTFTGHSLGGGIASVMAVWFNRPAVVFDHAPFELSARNPLIVQAVKIAVGVAGYDLGDFLGYNEFLNYATRELNVQGHHIDGEFLNYLRLALPTVSGSQVVTVGGGLNAIQLHSMALLTATELSANFRQATLISNQILPVIFDEKFYYSDVATSPERNFLVDLIRSEQDDRGNGKLSHFAADLNKLGTDLGGLNDAAQSALIAQGVEWYYWNVSSYTGQEFFTRNGSLLQYTTAQGADLVNALNKAAGYVNKWLDPIASAHGGTYYPALGTKQQWNVVTSATAGVVATALDPSKSQMFVAQGGADSLTGGNQSDVIFGGAGNDTLNGVNGNDSLYGGGGSDVYVFSGTFGQDVVIDSDGNGEIRANGVQLTGGKKVNDSYWISDLGDWSYLKLSNGDLLISQANSTNSVTIKQWEGMGGNKLGINLSQTAATDPTVVRTYVGDQRAPIALDGLGEEYYDWGQTSWETNGSLTGGTAQPDFADVIRGSSGADRIQGLGGHDALAGAAGDDELEGGDGDDLIAGGLGRDSIWGGAGNDFISSSADLTAPQRALPNETWSPPSAQTVLASGPTWGVYVDGEEQRWDGVGLVQTDDLSGDFIDGGAGNDHILASWGRDTVAGGADDDVVHGLAGDDVIFGEGGNDDLHGDGIEEEDTYISVPGASHGRDLIDGGAGNDSISGQGSDDSLFGGSGNDLIFGDSNVAVTYHGNDFLDGGADQDTMYGDGGNDTLFGGSGHDVMQGDNGDPTALDGNDFLDGEDGNDTMYGNGGHDTLYGGIGNDDLQGDSGVPTVFDGQDYLDGGAGNDFITGGGGNDTLYGGSGHDNMQGDNGPASEWDGRDSMDGGEGDDTLYGGGRDDTLLGGIGNDLLAGDTGVATAHDGNDHLSGEGGNDTLFGGGGHDTLYGGSGNDFLQGDYGSTTAYDGDDYLDGGEGNDTLAGGSGVNTLAGGVGNDLIQLKSDENVILFNRGDGTDTLSIVAGETSESNVIRLGAGITLADIRLTVGAGGFAGISLGAGDLINLPFAFAHISESNLISSIELFDGQSVAWASLITTQGENPVVVLNGTAGHNSLGDTANDDILIGGAGDDTMEGSSGNDTFIGGTGNDYIISGTGNDVYIFGKGDGVDIIDSPPAYNVSAGAHNILRFDSSVSSSEVKVTQSSGYLKFSIVGTTDQILATGYFEDDFIGIKNVIQEVQFSDGISWNLTEILENTFTDDDTGNLIRGTSTANAMFGNGGHDSLVGMAGNDTLYGGSGNDRIFGDADADLLYGGEGNDELYGGLGIDTLIGGEGNDFLASSEGTDIYRFNLGDGQDVVGQNPDAYWDADSDGGIVEFGAGIAPEDIILFETNDGLVFSIDGTTDSIMSHYFRADYNFITEVRFHNNVVWDYDEILLRLFTGGSGDDVFVGTSASNLIRGLDGNDILSSGSGDTVKGDGDDTLEGGAGNDTLYGGLGSDSLDGGTGADYMSGGKGNDIFVVDDVGDTVVELSNQGTDTVQSSISYTLGSNVERLTLTGANAINGTGNSLANLIIGNSAANTIDGGSGNDTMQGGLGDDIYVVAQAGDVVTENVNEGVDLVRSSITWTLGANLENLTLTGSSGIHATGNSLNNHLIGNSGNNTLTGNDGNDTLDGGAGTDTMRGGLGDDTYVVERAADVVTENANEGIDTVLSSVTLTLAANVENLTLTGSSTIHGTGNALDNYLTGNSANNTLSGAAGNNTLNGAAGNDTLVGGTGNDTYLLGAGYGAETIQENDSTSGNTDLLRFLEGIATDQIWFRQVSNNLEVSIIGTSDKATITNWYAGNQYKVEQFKTADNQTLLSTQVDALVSAMAAFSPPPPGQTTLTPAQQTALSPVIAANWT